MAFPASGDGRRSDRTRPAPADARTQVRGPRRASATGWRRAARHWRSRHRRLAGGRSGPSRARRPDPLDREAASSAAAQAARRPSAGAPRLRPAPGDRHPQGRDATAARRASARRARSRQGFSDAQTGALRAKPAQAAACARAKGASRRRAIRPEPGVQRGQSKAREPWRFRRNPPARAQLIPRTFRHRAPRGAGLDFPCPRLPPSLQCKVDLTCRPM